MDNLLNDTHSDFTRMETSEFSSRAVDQPRRRRVSETMDKAFAPEKYDEKQSERIYSKYRVLDRINDSRKKPIKRDKKKLDPFTNRLLKKSAICLALLGLIGVIKLVNTPFTQEVAGGIHSALTFEVSVDDAIGKLQFVGTEAANLAKVFAPVESFSLNRPVKGDIVEDFEATAHPYIAFATTTDELVMVCSKGEVIETGTDDELGNYVRVKHDSDRETTYYGMDQVTAKMEDSLEEGDSIGTMPDGEARMCLMLNVSSHAVDPSSYLK